MDRTHVVYRCFDADGVLLYVGRTSDLRGRCSSHRLRTPWWPTVAETTQTRSMTAAASRRYERIAIKVESPRHNVMTMLADHGTRSRYTRHGCRCAGCRAAHAVYMRTYMRNSRHAARSVA